MTDLGWHVIHGDDLLAAMRRCHEGENPDLVYAEMYANAEHKHHEEASQFIEDENQKFGEGAE